MSFARTALRIAAREALLPSSMLGAVVPNWPTIAGPRVYDSRLDPIAIAETPEAYAAAVDALENKPVITIYTEDDHSLPYGTEKVWPGQQTVTLIAELMIAARETVQVEAADGTLKEVGAIGAPVTSRQHEALLDALDAQVRYAFDITRLLPTNKLMRLVAMECASIHDDPQRTADRTARLALRTVKFHIKVKKEVYPDFADSSAPSGLNRLPSPLRDVAVALPAGSKALDLCNMLAGLVPGAPQPYPMLTGVDILASVNGRVPTTSDFDTRASAPTASAPSEGSSS